MRDISSGVLIAADHGRRATMKKTVFAIGFAICCLVFVGAAAIEQEGPPPRVAQVVALDECDPTTFNNALGPDFCKNIALGYATTLQTLLTEAAANNPDKNWDFEPDTLNINKGTVVSVTDQGGEPHTFTEVQQFGGGFIPPLNSGQAAVPECAMGFSDVSVAKTRILQGSTSQIAGLSKGTHYFQCCIHPWMRVTVNVK
jgi:plastocyanin